MVTCGGTDGMDLTHNDLQTSLSHHFRELEPKGRQAVVDPRVIAD